MPLICRSGLAPRVALPAMRDESESNVKTEQQVGSISYTSTTGIIGKMILRRPQQEPLIAKTKREGITTSISRVLQKNRYSRTLMPESALTQNNQEHFKLMHPPQLEVDRQIPSSFELRHRRLPQQSPSDPRALAFAANACQSLEELHAQRVVGALGCDHSRGKNA